MKGSRSGKPYGGGSLSVDFRRVSGHLLFTTLLLPQKDLSLATHRNTQYYNICFDISFFILVLFIFILIIAFLCLLIAVIIFIFNMQPHNILDTSMLPQKPL